MFLMQAADIVFTNTPQQIDPLQIPLHRVLATGYAAAAHTFWTLKARDSAQAVLVYEHEILQSMVYKGRWTGSLQVSLHKDTYQSTYTRVQKQICQLHTFSLQPSLHGAAGFDLQPS